MMLSLLFGKKSLVPVLLAVILNGVQLAAAAPFKPSHNYAVNWMYKNQANNYAPVEMITTVTTNGQVTWTPPSSDSHEELQELPWDSTGHLQQNELLDLLLQAATSGELASTAQGFTLSHLPPGILSLSQQDGGGTLTDLQVTPEQEPSAINVQGNFETQGAQGTEVWTVTFYLAKHRVKMVLSNSQLTIAGDFNNIASQLWEYVCAQTTGGEETPAQDDGADSGLKQDSQEVSGVEKDSIERKQDAQEREKYAREREQDAPEIAEEKVQEEITEQEKTEEPAEGDTGQVPELPEAESQMNQTLPLAVGAAVLSSANPRITITACTVQ